MYGVKVLETSTIPPFLFRAASHLSRGVERSIRRLEPSRAIKDTLSRGINTAEVIDPLDGYGVEYHSSLAEIDVRDLRHMLKNHVNYENKVASEFSSWSVSLLFVLVHAIRKMYNEKETNGLLIYVMDTTKLSPSRIFNSRELLRAYDLQTTPNLMDHALGEYLIHGRLINTGNLWKAIPLESLIEAGLWDLFPELNDRQGTDLLKARVRQLRSANFYTKPREIWSWHLESLAGIARCFGDKWQGIIIMALVTFRRRYTSEDVVTNLAHELGRLRFEVPQLPLFCAVHLVVHEIPEAAHCYEMIRKLNGREASLRAPRLCASSDQISNGDESANGTADKDWDAMDALVNRTVDKGWDDMDALIQEYRVAGAAS